MAQTESQQVPADPPAVLTQAVAPPSYDSLPPDVQKQQPPTAAPQQVPVQPEQPQQGVPFQAWPQGQASRPSLPVPAARSCCWRLPSTGTSSIHSGEQIMCCKQHVLVYCNILIFFY